MERYFVSVDRQTRHCQRVSSSSLDPEIPFVIPIKIPASFVALSKLVLKFAWRGKRPRISNTVLKQNKAGRLTEPNFKTYCKAMVIKTV